MVLSTCSNTFTVSCETSLLVPFATSTTVLWSMTIFNRWLLCPQLSTGFGTKSESRVSISFDTLCALVRDSSLIEGSATNVHSPQAWHNWKIKFSSYLCICCSPKMACTKGFLSHLRVISFATTKSGGRGAPKLA